MPWLQATWLQKCNLSTGRGQVRTACLLYFNAMCVTNHHLNLLFLFKYAHPVSCLCTCAHMHADPFLSSPRTPSSIARALAQCTIVPRITPRAHAGQWIIADAHRQQGYRRRGADSLSPRIRASPPPLSRSPANAQRQRSARATGACAHRQAVVCPQTLARRLRPLLVGLSSANLDAMF